MHRYPEALQIVENVSNEATASDSAAGKGGLDISHLYGSLLLKPAKQDALHFIKAATVHRKDNTTGR